MTEAVRTGLGLTFSAMAFSRLFSFPWQRTDLAGRGPWFACTRHGSGAADDAGPGVFTGLTKTEAEELLDWLEGHGRKAVEVEYTPQGYTIRCAPVEEPERAIGVPPQVRTRPANEPV